MSDTKLRELERRWKETGSVEDEAAYLLERVRVGDLTQERLELAAYCGHEGARRASGPTASTSPAAKGEWMEGLKRWGVEVFVRGAVAAARVALFDWESTAPDPEARLAVDAAAEWVACPCRGHEEAAARAQRNPARRQRALADAVRQVTSQEANEAFREHVQRAVREWALSSDR